MKPKQEPIRTIPEGVWEATHTDTSVANCHRTGKSPAQKPKGCPPKDGKATEPPPENLRPGKGGPVSD